MNPSSHQSSVITAEIRALLMLVLLKGGARANEIQTALQMAALSGLTGADEEFAASPEAPMQRAPTNGVDVHRLTPKQVVRNSYLAPIKGYAA
jgi:hypothetical protein